MTNEDDSLSRAREASGERLSPAGASARTDPPSHSQHRIDQQRRPVYVGGPSQSQGAAPQPQGGIGGFLSSIGDSLSNVFSMFG